MANLVHLSNSASSEEIIDILNRDAGVIIDNLLHLDDISRINEDLKPYLQNDCSSYHIKQKVIQTIWS